MGQGGPAHLQYPLESFALVLWQGPIGAPNPAGCHGNEDGSGSCRQHETIRSRPAKAGRLTLTRSHPQISLPERKITMLDKALEALKTYDWGMDPNLIKPIDEAIVA